MKNVLPGFYVVCLVIVAYLFFLAPVNALTATPIQSDEVISNEVPKPKPVTGCKVSGCSGELCIPSDSDVASICVYKEEYACYKNANCAVQSDGNCGWTQTEELNACLSGNPQPHPQTSPASSPQPASSPTLVAVAASPLNVIGVTKSLPAPSCIPRPPCLDTEPRCLLPVPLGGWCDEEVVTSPTPEPENDACTASGGVWRDFPNSCGDSCAQVSEPGQVMCLQAMNQACDCGENSCWDGTSCAPNPDGVKPLQTPIPVFRFLNLNTLIPHFIIFIRSIFGN